MQCSISIFPSAASRLSCNYVAAKYALLLSDDDFVYIIFPRLNIQTLSHYRLFCLHHPDIMVWIAIRVVARTIFNQAGQLFLPLHLPIILETPIRFDSIHLHLWLHQDSPEITFQFLSNVQLCTTILHPKHRLDLIPIVMEILPTTGSVVNGRVPSIKHHVLLLGMCQCINCILPYTASRLSCSDVPATSWHNSKGYNCDLN